ncbi:MAG: rhomboid family intramembrane serine protease [Actinomycetota bacterium]|nr:rhomboid family intramembrane serine protease [Actinomycetota bacterium]
MVPGTSLIPIHDENPTSTFSYLTALLIAVNVVILFFVQPNFGQDLACPRGFTECAIQRCRVQQFFYEWGLVPDEVTDGSQLTGSVCPGFPLRDKSVLGSIVTSMFLHGGILHLGGNMLFLWVFGNNIEDRLGRVKFLLFYFVVGIAAGLAHVLANPDSQIPTVGASGAVSGLLGAYMVLFPRAHIHAILPIPILWLLLGRIRLPAFVVLGMWFVSQFFIGQGQQPGEGGVAWVAHVGGFIAGAILIFVFGGWRERQRPQPQPGWPYA